jgi:hypothetical protein
MRQVAAGKASYVNLLVRSTSFLSGRLMLGGRNVVSLGDTRALGLYDTARSRKHLVAHRAMLLQTHSNINPSDPQKQWESGAACVSLARLPHVRELKARDIWSGWTSRGSESSSSMLQEAIDLVPRRRLTLPDLLDVAALHAILSRRRAPSER